MIFRLALFAILVIATLLALYFFTRKKWDWNSYAGSLAVLFAVLLLIPLAMFSWVSYENRLKPVTEFSGIALGSSSAQVKFIKGQADAEHALPDGGSHWRYIDKLNTGNHVDVYFDNGQVRELAYSGSCRYCENINGFGIGSPYEDIVKRFGESQDIQVSEDELEHRHNYPEYRVFFVFKEGKVIQHGIYQP